jgi:hypothetical protein
MDRVALTRMQIRAVLTVFRSEGERLRRRHPEDDGADALERLRARSIELLENARQDLDGESAENVDVVTELDAAREEVEAARVSVGLRGDRLG